MGDSGTQSGGTPADEAQNGGVYPCRKCQVHCTTGIKCNECLMWTHYECSGIVLYLLITLINSTRRYTCQVCTETNIQDYSDLVTEIEELKIEEKRIIKEAKDKGVTGDLSRQSVSPDMATGTEHNVVPSIPPQLSTTTTLGDTPEDVDFSHLNSPQQNLQGAASPETNPQPSSHGHTSQQVQSVCPQQEVHQAHTRQQQHTPPPHQQDNGRSSPRKPICKQYRRGVCKYGLTGKNCNYEHPKLCNRLMAHGIRGKLGCKQGWKCDMFHPTMCRNSLRYSKCFTESCTYMHVRGTKRRDTRAHCNTSVNARPQAHPTNAQVPTSPTMAYQHPSVESGQAPFLDIALETRQAVQNLMKVMEAQGKLLANLARSNPMPYPPQPPNHPYPWVNALSH